MFRPSAVPNTEANSRPDRACQQGLHFVALARRQHQHQHQRSPAFRAVEFRLHVQPGPAQERDRALLRPRQRAAVERQQQGLERVVVEGQAGARGNGRAIIGHAAAEWIACDRHRLAAC
jgi:hypothetical protein